MIQINDVNFAYNRKDLIFENLSIRFRSGSIYGLLGKNGSGKTTLMKLISGLRYPVKGDILIDEVNSLGRHPEYLSKLFIIPEEFDFPKMTIESFIEVNSVFYRNFEEPQFYYYLEEFNVPKDAIITKLSLGQKKKFLLSYGFATNTEVLLMDEPTNGLDIPSKVQFRKILAQLANDDRIFIISTHQIKDIEEIIDNISIIDGGVLKFSASIGDLQKKLVFGEKDTFGMSESDILFEEKHFGGNRIIGLNIDGTYTPVNLELLFNAVINGKSKINEIFENTKIENDVKI